MSAAASPRPSGAKPAAPAPRTKPRRRPRSASRIAWVIAGDAAVAALALAQVLHGDERLVVVVALMVIASVVALGDLAVRLASASRSGALWRFLRTGVLVAAALAGVAGAYRLAGLEATLLVLALLVGVALMAHWLVGVIERSVVEPTPWQQLGAAAGDAGSGSGEPGLASQAAEPAPWPRSASAFIGAGLLLFVTIDVLAFGQVQQQLGLDGARGAAVGVAACLALVALIAGPLVLAAQAGARRDRAQRDRARERQAVGAHLHDSVLQTLALIQRSATDPDRVVQLARQQERGLRAWLAGDNEADDGSLAAALEAVVVEVEGEAGVLVDCVIGGDLPVDDRVRSLVAATREALRNAARHGGGDVRLFLDVDPVSATVFIRDDGPGFDLERVDTARRGVRDAMIARMHHAGGTATIDSSAAGTEVALRLPRKDGGS